MTCLPFMQMFSCTGVQIHTQRENSDFISSNMHLEIPAFGQQKSPINRAFRGTYLFYVPVMAEEKGFEPLRRVTDLLVFEARPFNHLGTPPYCAFSGSIKAARKMK